MAVESMQNIRHTGENIAEKIEQATQRIGFSLDKCICLVRDDASNMQLASQLINIPKLNFNFCSG